MAATLEVADCKTATATAAPTTGITITKPTNLADGDVLYAVVAKNSYASTAAFTCSGWTEVTSGTRGTTTGNDRHLCILRKVITNAAGEAASYTFVTTDTTSRNMAGIILRVSGANTSTPEDASVPSITFASDDATPASRDITTATAGALVIQVCILSMNSGTALKTWGAPSGYDTHANISVGNTTGSLELQVGAAYKTLGNAGAAGTNAWTHTADDSTSENGRTVIAVRSANYSVTPAPSAIAAPATLEAPTTSTISYDRARKAAFSARVLAPGVIPTGSNLDSINERAHAVLTVGMTSVTNATVTASAIAATASVPSITFKAAATVSAAAIAAPASQPAITFKGHATPTPSAIAAPASMPSATVYIVQNATREVDEFELHIEMDQPSIRATAVVVASSIAATAAVPAPTITTADPNATVVASAIAATAALPAVTMSTGSTMSATAIAAPATQPAVAVTASATVVAGALAAPASIGAPTITCSATVVAAAIAATAALPAPTVQTGIVVTVSSITAPAALGAVAVTASATVAASAVGRAAVLDAPTLQTGVTLTPSSISAPASIPAATVGLGTTVAVSAIGAVAGVGAPTLHTGATASVSPVAASAGVGAPTVGEGREVAAASVVAPAGVDAPTVSVTDYYRASVAGSYLQQAQVRLPTGADDQASRQYHAGLPYLRLGGAVVVATAIAAPAGVGAPAVTASALVVVTAVEAVAGLEAEVVIPTVIVEAIAALAGLDAAEVTATAVVVVTSVAAEASLDASVPFQPTVAVVAIGCVAGIGPHPRPQAMRSMWGRQRIATDRTLPDVVRAGANDGR